MNLKQNVVTAILLSIGLAQIAGDMFNINPLKGLAAGTAASPAPKVFTSVRGMETFSTEFTLSWFNERGEGQRKVITHEIYPGLLGPYNRRNIWGAMLAYGPFLATEVLTKDMFHIIVKYGMCDEAPVLKELGIDAATVNDLSISYKPREGTDTALPLRLVAGCDK